MYGFRVVLALRGSLDGLHLELPDGLLVRAVQVRPEITHLPLLRVLLRDEFPPEELRPGLVPLLLNFLAPLGGLLRFLSLEVERGLAA